MRGRFDDMLVDGVTLRRYLKTQAEAKTLGGNVTQTNEDGVLQAYDAGGSSRNVTLPARAATNDGQIRIFYNASTAGENLVIKNSAATTLLTLPSGAVALVFGSCAAEAPGTREWVAVPVGGEDLALADDLAVTGDTALTGTLTVTGAAALNGASNTIGSATSHVLKLYGVTGSSQRASSNQVSTNAAVSASFGATQLAILQELMNTMTATGLWKGAA